MNLCNYRAQIGLAPHEAALDLLIIVQKRMEKEEARGIKNVGIGWQQFNSFAKNEIAITHRIFMAIAQPNKKQEKKYRKPTVWFFAYLIELIHTHTHQQLLISARRPQKIFTHFHLHLLPRCAIKINLNNM